MGVAMVVESECTKARGMAINKVPPLIYDLGKKTEKCDGCGNYKTFGGYSFCSD